MRRNLAARIGVWSTHHRKTAILGWLLFVVLATGIGGATGMVEMTNAENGAGESARAEQILLDAGLDKPWRTRHGLRPRSGRLEARRRSPRHRRTGDRGNAECRPRPSPPRTVRTR